MNKLSILLTGIIAVLSASAQQKTSTLTVTINGNKDLRLSIDGIEKGIAGQGSGNNIISIAFNDLEMKQHSFEAIRTGDNSNRSERITTTFNLRSRYDMLLKLNRNGSLELIETRRTRVSNNELPMNTADFNNLYRNVRNQRSATGRRTVIANAFNTPGAYFTTLQVVQLLQLENEESFRLQMAKSAYHTITDKKELPQLYYLFSNQNSKNELEDYINSYEEDNVKSPMTDLAFNTLYRDIQQEWPLNSQMNSLTSAFNNSSNYFSSYQASRLIQIIRQENYRLQLAKLSYHTISDPANFRQVVNLLSNQSSKDELATYINNNNGVNTPRIAMTESNFNDLYKNIQQSWPLSSQMNLLSGAFNNNDNYFSTSQAGRLIQIVAQESNRLQLAKLSYRSITDPSNFTEIYSLFNSQLSKNELAAFIRENNSGGNTNIAMSDDSFTNLYKTIQSQFFPNQKLNSLTTEFSNSNNYFTAEQAKQLIALVSFESNRLQLSKLSYRTITNRDNFNIIYDLLNNQSSKNELDAYVRSYKD